MSITALSSASSALNAFSQGMHSVAYDVTDIERENHLRTEFVEGDNSQVQAYTEVIPSSTDYAREMVNSIVYQRSFEANTVVVQTVDDMLGTVIDMKV